jgi:hypothetical protein
MQKWEYLTITRSRSFEYIKKTDICQATDWDEDIPAKLPKLGEEGWELVSVSPRSGILGGIHTSGGAPSLDYDFAGFTSAEQWVFKRPKE